MVREPRETMHREVLSAAFEPADVADADPETLREVLP